jgi:ABC-type Zn uptake system ZnuABC Zn-binding protein ZnuA
MSTTILTVIRAAAVLVSELAPAVPIIEKMVKGQQPSAEDIAALETIAEALNAKAAALENNTAT